MRPRQESRAGQSVRPPQAKVIPISHRRGAGPGLDQWMLGLMREEGREPRRTREPPRTFVALRDLWW
jgi:hypothetical protein